MSANIEDWIEDSKKGSDTSRKSLPSFYKECLCENDTEVKCENETELDHKNNTEIKHEIDTELWYEEDCVNGNHTTNTTVIDAVSSFEEEEVERLDDLVDNRHKRYSFFARYFRQQGKTEDLVKNTPSRLAGFFNKVLHVQKKHKFNGRHKSRSKTTVQDGVVGRPKLKSFRQLMNNKTNTDTHSIEKTHSYARRSLIPKNIFPMEITEQNNVIIPRDEVEGSFFDHGSVPALKKSSHESKVVVREKEACYKNIILVDNYDEIQNNEQNSLASFECNDSPSDNFDVDETYFNTWSKSNLNKSHHYPANSQHQLHSIPRCFSESDVEVLRVKVSSNCWTMSPRQSQHRKKGKNWNIFNYIQHKWKG